MGKTAGFTPASEVPSISVNDQWRICFRFAEGDAYDVELTDYH